MRKTMISNEKRREVAAMLRNRLKYMLRKGEWYGKDLDSNACGNAAYRNIAASVEDCGNLIDGNYIHIVELLADLIDRPTCQMVECSIDNGSRSWGMRCTACGEEFEHMKPGFGWRFCPVCGAVVTEKEEDND